MPTRLAAGAGYGMARTRKEVALAGLRELQLLERRGELIRKDLVERDAFKTGRIVRDAFMAIPDRLAGLLAAETDQKKIHALLTKEFRQVLEVLAPADPVALQHDANVQSA